MYVANLGGVLAVGDDARNFDGGLGRGMSNTKATGYEGALDPWRKDGREMELRKKGRLVSISGVQIVENGRTSTGWLTHFSISVRASMRAWTEVVSMCELGKDESEDDGGMRGLTQWRNRGRWRAKLAWRH